MTLSLLSGLGVSKRERERERENTCGQDAVTKHLCSGLPLFRHRENFPTSLVPKSLTLDAVTVVCCGVHIGKTTASGNGENVTRGSSE